jgi:hypothetical protein
MELRTVVDIRAGSISQRIQTMALKFMQWIVPTRLIKLFSLQYECVDGEFFHIRPFLRGCNGSRSLSDI